MFETFPFVAMISVGFVVFDSVVVSMSNNVGVDGIKQLLRCCCDRGFVQHTMSVLNRKSRRCLQNSRFSSNQAKNCPFCVCGCEKITASKIRRVLLFCFFLHNNNWLLYFHLLKWLSCCLHICLRIRMLHIGVFFYVMGTTHMHLTILQ